MAATISSFAMECQRDNVPLLFLDTCSLLDILRFHTRMGSGKALRNLSAVTALRDAAPTRIRLVSPIQVDRELTANKDDTLKDALRTSNEINEKSSAQASVLNFLDANYDLPTFPNSERIKDLSEQFLDSCMDKIILLEDDQGCKDKAFSRALSDIPPASRGGAVKDCTILEHCLELSRQLRAGGYTQKIVFLSNNTHDYCVSKNSTALKAPIDEDFNSLQMSFTNSWEWAKKELCI